VKPTKLTTAERIAKRINRDIKAGATDATLVALVISGVDRNESHPVHTRILAEAKKERLIK